MELKNKDWKIKKIEKLKKKAYIFSLYCISVSFLLGLFPSIFGSWWIIVDIPLIALICFFSYRNAKSLWALSQNRIIYSIDEKIESGEWERYVVSVDYQLDKMYEKRKK